MNQSVYNNKKRKKTTVPNERNIDNVDNIEKKEKLIFQMNDFRRKENVSNEIILTK